MASIGGLRGWCKVAEIGDCIGNDEGGSEKDHGEIGNVGFLYTRQAR